MVAADGGVLLASAGLKEREEKGVDGYPAFTDGFLRDFGADVEKGVGEIEITPADADAL